MTAPPPPPWNETWRTVEARLVAALDEIARLTAVVEEARRHAIAETLQAVEQQARDHLYTNTKNGNRAAMLNIVERVRAERATGEGT